MTHCINIEQGDLEETFELYFLAEQSLGCRRAVLGKDGG
jgi:hypothetical protein